MQRLSRERESDVSVCVFVCIWGGGGAGGVVSIGWG